MNDHRTESSELKLERLISGVVAGLPTRRAPLTLEGRVLAAISEGNTPLARAQGFASWPAPLKWGSLDLQPNGHPVVSAVKSKARSAA